MQKIFLLFCAIICISTNCFGQFIEGQFSGMKNMEIKLEGLNGTDTYLIAKTNTNEMGVFKFSYTSNDIGMAYLSSQGSQSYIILLGGENIAITGESFSSSATIKVIKGSQSIAFVKYNQEQIKKEQLLSAWKFLKKNYTANLELKKNIQINKTISDEIIRLNKSEQDFFNTLPDNSYVKWLLPIRKLISSLPVAMKYYPEEVKPIFEQIKKLDYSDSRLFKSGLIEDALDAPLEIMDVTISNSERATKEVNSFIDIILLQVTNDEKKYNQVVELLFKILDKHSFFDSTEYLTNKVENNSSCSRSDGVTAQLQKYKKLAVGSKLPDIEFGPNTVFPNGVSVNKLSEIKKPYILVVFAAGWCPHCTESIPKIAQLYPNLKAKGIEVVLVSLDENVEKFRQFTGSLPFVSTSDYKKWSGEDVKNFNVHATPSYFILDQNLSLVLRPRDIQQIKTWAKEK